MNHPHTTASQSCSTLQDWLFYIEQTHPIDRIELGLERVRRVAERAELASLPGHKILLAGTNGKGSTARCLEQLLLAQGLTVGVYTSPHLLTFNERLRIQGVDVSDALWMQGLAQVEALREGIPLTYFEFTTLAAFAILRQQQVQVCIIEVGLGGRLDATNIIEPDVSVITTVDLDHQDWLGSDRESIGREKAGIFRAGGVAVVGDLAVPQTVLQQAELLQVNLQLVNRDYRYQVNQANWHWYGPATELLELPLPQLPIQNIATSLATLAQLQLLPPRDKIVTVLTQLSLPGRMQWLAKSPAILVDVAHNPQSVGYLAAQLQLIAVNYPRVHALVGMLKDKDMKQSLQSLAPVVTHWHCVSLPGPRGAAAEVLAEQIASVGAVDCHASLALGWQTLLPQLQENDLVVVFGSFVTVSQFMALWQQDKL